MRTLIAVLYVFSCSFAGAKFCTDLFLTLSEQAEFQQIEAELKVSLPIDRYYALYDQHKMSELKSIERNLQRTVKQVRERLNEVFNNAIMSNPTSQQVIEYESLRDFELNMSEHLEAVSSLLTLPQGETARNRKAMSQAIKARTDRINELCVLSEVKSDSFRDAVQPRKASLPQRCAGAKTGTNRVFGTLDAVKYLNARLIMNDQLYKLCHRAGLSSIRHPYLTNLFYLLDKDSDLEIAVTEDTQSIIGFAVIRHESVSYKGQILHDSEIKLICTDETTKGVGRSLVGYLEMGCDGNVPDLVSLDAVQSAVGAYQKMGFVLTDASDPQHIYHSKLLKSGEEKLSKAGVSTTPVEFLLKDIQKKRTP